MSAPKKYDAETRERAVRMHRDRISDHGGSKIAVRRHVGELLDIKPEALRNWIKAADRAGAPVPSPTGEQADVD